MTRIRKFRSLSRMKIICGDKMRFLCYYIALLNIVDALATYIGVSGRHIQECILQ